MQVQHFYDSNNINNWLVIYSPQKKFDQKYQVQGTFLRNETYHALSTKTPELSQ